MLKRPNKEKGLKADLFRALSSSEDERGEFLPSKFFHRWFQEQGSSYFFLFKKNLKVTNIQFAELLALIRTHLNVRKGYEPIEIHGLQFLSTSEFTTAVEAMVTAFRGGPANRPPNYNLIIDLYYSNLSQMLVIDSFFGSCAVFLPPHLTIDLVSICAYSGYVHSCGKTIFIQKVDKCTTSEIFSSIKRHLEKNINQGQKAFFTAYAHEDFSEGDRYLEKELRHGLDDVKLPVEKMYIGDQDLVTVLRGMRVIFGDSLVIPDPGDYRKVHKEFRKKPHVDKSRTIWLIVERSIGEASRFPSDQRYYICFDQEYKNENPFHIFDENKPAWISHTTIPHTLMGAMINITQPGWPNKSEIKLADPFVGTGTTLLESIKFSRIKVSCSDRLYIAPLLAADNLEVFSASSQELARLEAELSAIMDPKPGGNFKAAIDACKWAMEIILPPLANRGNAQPIDFSLYDKIEITNNLRSKPLFTRICFYLGLRAVMRHLPAVRRKARRFKTAFEIEAKELAAQLRRLRDLKSREEEAVERKSSISLFQGTYSKSCSVSSENLKAVLKGKRGNQLVMVKDARELKGGPFDVIVTDPPYGFNTEENQEELARLYSEAIIKMVDSLKENGELVLCLPDRSHIGRHTHFFTQKEVVTAQVLAAVKRRGGEAVDSAEINPPPSKIFRAPYYWESERALRRCILHFRIRGCRKLASV